MSKKIGDKELEDLHNEFDNLKAGQEFIIPFIGGIDIKCYLYWDVGLSYSLRICEIVLSREDETTKVISHYLSSGDLLYSNKSEFLYQFCLNHSRDFIKKCNKKLVSFDKKCERYYRKICGRYYNERLGSCLRRLILLLKKRNYSKWWEKEFLD